MPVGWPAAMRVFGADGFAGRAGLDRSTIAAIDAAEAPDPREQVARVAMAERLALAVE
jgi:hypothetical protein